MSPTERELELQVDLLLRVSKWAEAIRLLVAQPSLVSSSFKLNWNLGWANFKLGNLVEAEKALRSALAISPDSPVANWALASVCHEAGDITSAEALYRRAITLKPGRLPRQGLALLLHQQGRLTEAEDLYLEIIRDRPEDLDRFRDYAAFLSDAGREAESVDVLRSLTDTESQRDAGDA
jgi:Flp pilus assembly protein TadD